MYNFTEVKQSDNNKIIMVWVVWLRHFLFESYEYQPVLLIHTQHSAIGVPCVYMYTPTFIGIRMILDMRTLTCTLIFSMWSFKVFKTFLALIILYCSKTYCYIFDLYFFKIRRNRFFTFVLHIFQFFIQTISKYFSLPHIIFIISL